MKVPCVDCGKAHEQTEDCANGENKFILVENCGNCGHWKRESKLCIAYGLNNHKCKDNGYNNWRAKE